MLSIIIPSNSAGLSKLNLLKTRLSALSPQSCEVIIIISDPTEPIWRLRALFDDLSFCRLLFFKSAQSAAVNRNLGIAHAKGQFIAFWDDDDDIEYVNYDQILNLKPGNYLVTCQDFNSISDLILSNKMHHSNFIFHHKFLSIWNENNFPGEDWLFVYECLSLNYSGSFYLCTFKYNYAPKIYELKGEHCYNFILENEAFLTPKAISYLEKAIMISSLERQLFDLIPSVHIAKICAKIFYYIK